MNTLSDFQADFINAVLQPSNDSKQEFCSTLQNTQGLNTEEQLNIYSQSIYNGLINALIDIYPVCEKLTSEGFFYAMAKQYIIMHPSHSPDLANFGEQFSDFIINYSAADSVPYLADMAKLEWSYHRAFHANDQSLIDLTEFSKYSADQLTQCVFSLAEGYCLFQSLYPVDDIWNMHQNEEYSNLDLEETPCHFYIYRKAYEIHIDKITSNEYLFLESISKQRAFIKVCDDLTDDINVSEVLVKSLQLGWISNMKIDT